MNLRNWYTNWRGNTLEEEVGDFSHYLNYGELHQITDNIFLGPVVSGEEDIATLKALGINSILAFDNVDSNIWEDLTANDIEYKYIKMSDFGLPSMDNIGEAITYLNDANSRGKTVYIHCMGGIGRSNIMLMLYFISKGVPPNVAESYIFSKRPLVGLSEMQKAYFDELMDWHNNGRQGPMPNPEEVAQSIMEGMEKIVPSETPYEHLNEQWKEDAAIFEDYYPQ